MKHSWPNPVLSRVYTHLARKHHTSMARSAALTSHERTFCRRQLSTRPKCLAPTAATKPQQWTVKYSRRDTDRCG